MGQASLLAGISTACRNLARRFFSALPTANKSIKVIFIASVGEEERQHGYPAKIRGYRKIKRPPDPADGCVPFLTKEPHLLPAPHMLLRKHP